MTPFVDKIYMDSNLVFHPHCLKYQYVLDWPPNWPDLNPIEKLWLIVNRKMKDMRPNSADELRAVITAASLTPQQSRRLIASLPCRTDAVIHAEGVPNK